MSLDVGTTSADERRCDERDWIARVDARVHRIPSSKLRTPLSARGPNSRSCSAKAQPDTRLWIAVIDRAVLDARDGGAHGAPRVTG
jgi:hypothetical protein